VTFFFLHAMHLNFSDFIIHVSIALILLVSVSVQAEPVKQTNDAQIPKESAGCLVCHRDPKTAAIFDTPHGQGGDSRTPFAGTGCETCHGDERPHPAIHFGKKSVTPVEEQNRICLGCHESEQRIHWMGSTHQSSNVSCASCHSIHANRDPIMDKFYQNDVCYACHAVQKAQSFLRSRHPLREAIMVCADCHNPHGTTSEFLLRTNTINENCYSCHAEKRGPFLWEHPPVQENCGLCHTPHGSTQDRLLKVRGPFLCQQCHAGVFHSSLLNDGGDVPPIGAGNRLLAENCLNCHYMIHGSNHPAGVAFDR